MAEVKKTNRGGLWKGSANHYGRLDMDGTEYNVVLWKLEGGNGLLIFGKVQDNTQGILTGDSVLLYQSDKCLLSGRMGTKDNTLGWVNVYKSDSTNEKAPVLNLTFKPATGVKPNAIVQSQDF